MDAATPPARKRRRSITPAHDPRELRNARPIKRQRLASRRCAVSWGDSGHQSPAHLENSRQRSASEPPPCAVHHSTASKRHFHDQPTSPDALDEHNPPLPPLGQSGRRRRRSDQQSQWSQSSLRQQTPDQVDANYSKDRDASYSALADAEHKRSRLSNSQPFESGSPETNIHTSSPANLDDGSGQSNTISTPRTPASPGPMLHLVDFVDPDFGWKVAQGLQVKEALTNFNQGRRIHMYGQDVADAYPSGRTPSPEREKYQWRHIGRR